MNQRTNLFLAGANLTAHRLFQKIAAIQEPLETRVLYVAIPSKSIPIASEPFVEFHLQFTPPCWDETFITGLHGLEGLDNSSKSEEAVHQRISTAISGCVGAGEFEHFCSWPVMVEGYLVCAVLQLPKPVYDSVPRILDLPHPYEHPVQFSLVDLAIRNYLSDCRGELQNPATDPFRGWTPYSETLGAAGWAISAWAVAVVKGGPIVSELFFACTELASTQYEKRDCVGSMIVSARQHPNVKPVVWLRESVPITELRTSRKLLQLSVEGHSLLFDGDGIYGVGEISTGYDVQTKNLFTVKFTKPGTWELRHEEQPLMVVHNGNPRLPIPAFPEPMMRQHLSRLFGTMSIEVQAHLCNLAKAACEQKHGTTFVISIKARDEAERLKQQCFPLSPLPLIPALLPSLTDIDGAVLLDLDGTCHAIGVILDGRVSAEGPVVGHRGRGARYNSALRYAADENCPKCLIIVRSEDGMLDFLPGGETKAAGDSRND